MVRSGSSIAAALKDLSQRMKTETVIELIGDRRNRSLRPLPHAHTLVFKGLRPELGDCKLLDQDIHGYI